MASKKTTNVVAIESKKKPAKAPKGYIGAEIGRSELAAGLATVARAVGSSMVVSALADVKIDFAGTVATITATDLDVVMTKKVQVDSTYVGGPGAMLVPHRLLANVTQVADGKIELTLDGDHVVATSGEFVARMATHTLDDFPTLDSVGGEPITVQADRLQFALATGLVATSGDQTRPVLTSLLLDNDGAGSLRVVSTDSYRMMIIDVLGVPPLADGPMLLPAKAAALMAGVVAREDEVLFRTDMQRVELMTNTTTVSARLIEGSFPQYERILPQQDDSAVMTVNRSQLAKAVRRVRVMLDAERPIYLEVEADAVTVCAFKNDERIAKEKVACKYAGEPVKLAFSGQFLSDGLQALSNDTDMVDVLLGNTSKPSLFVAGPVRYLLMPVKG